MPYIRRKKKYSIAAVDDSRSILMYLKKTLMQQDYEVETYQESDSALQAMLTNIPDLILLDINMPNISGYELCNQIKSTDTLKETPIIFVSSKSNTDVKIKAFNLGAQDYIIKPFEAEELLARVKTHLRLSELRNQQEADNKQLRQLVAEQVEEISNAQLGTIKALATLAEYRDEDTGIHLTRVSEYCKLLGYGLREQKKKLVTREFVETVAAASPLHDIGKVAIPDRILLKPGKLTDEEFTIMKTHAAVGAKTLKSVLGEYAHNRFLSIGADIALSHHEKWNGKGYPFGLEGEDIPLSGRIMALADVYDALRARRCYKPSFSHEKSMNIILKDAGTHFDPTLAHIFKEKEAEFNDIWEHHSE